VRNADDSVSSRDRRDTIMRLVLEEEDVTVRDLADRFSVSAMTVHRDLDSLEAIGVLRKVRGGATAQPSSMYESSLAFRLGRGQGAKRRIAEEAARRVSPGQSVALDDSTTTLAMVPFLAEIPQLTIVTHFASVIEEVARLTQSTLHVIVIGGTYNHKYHSFGGIRAEQQLLELAVDHSFVSVSSVDVERGAFHQELDQAALKRTLVQIARDSALLVDASKFATGALHRVVELQSFDAIYVDDATPPEIVGRLRSRGGPEIHVADRDAPPATTDRDDADDNGGGGR
jgi:DeoR/GlpR family transcriptional regulator of sugar metabolism